MTTAGRPTMESARGTDYRGGRMYVPTMHFCERDAPSHTKLKYRQAGQGTEEELLSRDLVSELIERESQASEKEANRKKVGLVIPDIKAIGAASTTDSRNTANLDADDSDLESSSSDEDDDDDRENAKEASSVNSNGVKRTFTEMNDNEEKEDDDDDSDDDDDDDDDDDSDEETAELLAELEKIKKERAEEQARAKAAAEARSEEEKDMAALVGNPLMANDSAEYSGGEVRDSFTVEQKWYEDSVFKNQSRGEPDHKKKRFINDTVRNQFHLQFLKKYIT